MASQVGNVSFVVAEKWNSMSSCSVELIGSTSLNK